MLEVIQVKRHILPVIVLAQFCCTSLWFAGNGVMNDLITHFDLQASALGQLTVAVQLGFIIGTLVFAVLSLPDRYSPSLIFLLSACAGAIFNAGTIWEANNLTNLLGFRFFTGFFLAGIYPVGMKIAADYYDKGLGKSLGYLVGALVLGTAFPHLLKAMGEALPWKWVLLSTSLIAVMGGLSMYVFVPDGPHRRPSPKLDFTGMWKVFGHRPFRQAAFGYFGHMWELYAFWAFVPLMLSTYNTLNSPSSLSVPFWSFFVIGIGGLSCVVGGYFSLSFGTKRVASLALLLSGLCGLVSPLMFQSSFPALFIAFLLFWGMMVIADSPQFSTLVAQNAPPESKGTALTIVNSIGFAITIISIQLLSFLQSGMNPILLYVVLALGPLLGLMALMDRKKDLRHNSKHA